MGDTEARSKLGLAKSHLERVQDAAWGEPDYVEAVTWAFYAYENAVVAAAEKLGLPWERTHPSKAEVARVLHAQGAVSTDVSSLLLDLNELRKSVAYGEAGPQLEELGLEDLARELEEFIDEVDALIEGTE